MEMFHNKSLVEVKGDEVVIYVFLLQMKKTLSNVNNIDKRYKEDKSTDKKTWDVGRFPYGRDYKYGWKQNGSTEELTLKYPVPGCKLGGFSKIFDQYKTVLKERLITNNRNHDTVFSTNQKWIDWNYGENRGRKRGMKVAIITNFARMQ